MQMETCSQCNRYTVHTSAERRLFLCIYFDAKNKMGNGGDIFSEEVHQIKVMCFENEPMIAIFQMRPLGPQYHGELNR